MSRILAVDGDSASAARIQDILKADAHDVITARDSAEALTTFTQRGLFDLVVIDVSTPGLAGIDLCRRLKAASLEFLPVMLLARDGTVADRVAGLDGGADECMCGDPEPMEVQARARTLLRIKASHQQAADVAHLDLTTGIPNKRALSAQLRASFALAQRHKDPYALLTIDLDGLEKINSAEGRNAGDEVRRVAASAIGGALRATDGAYCVQGGEFVVLAPGADIDGAIQLGERIRRAIEASHVPWRDAELRATASVGVAVIPHREITSADQLVAEAGRALLAAKRAGRNCLMVHGDDDPGAG
jgi:diguanylate cyclase (GGDEF)-like protein